MARQLRVLVIDDEPDMLLMMRMMLTAEGFDVIEAGDAISGLRTAYRTHPDAILLDVAMPDMDGFDACRRLRELTDIPILFVTARDALTDVVEGFSVSADDYVVKPFNCSELISRLMARLRRVDDGGNGRHKILPLTTSILLDCSRRELAMGAQTIRLTAKEFEVLRLLIRHAGKVLSVDTILTEVWGAERVGEPDLVKQYMYRLRRKIEPEPSAPRYLHTVRSGGYYFDANHCS